MTISSPNASPLYRTVHGSADRRLERLCSLRELEYAIGNGAVGATTNPSIVLSVLRKEFDAWKGKLRQLIAENPTANEDVIAWKLIEEMGLRGAEMLLPVFERERRLKGRLSMQTNPVNYMDFSKLVEQAIHFDGLAPNIQVKIPATAAGIVAIEEATRLGVNINATVSFTLPQAIAVAEAVERGLDRRAKEGHDVSGMRPVCTIMIGRTGRLAESRRQARGRHHYARPSRLGRHRRLQEGLRHLQGARLPRPAAGRSLSPPHALVGADRRRRHFDDSLRMAGAIQ